MNWLPETLFFLLVPAGRMHGIGGWSGWRIIAYIALVVGFSAASYVVAGWSGLLAGPAAAIGMAAGHGNFYAMKGAAIPDEPESVERSGVRWFWIHYIGRAVDDPLYSWWCMGWKWLGIVGTISVVVPQMLIMLLFAPAAYTVSMHFFKTSAIAEWLNFIMVALLVYHSVSTHL
jgi:hypothetical protein